jgi:hypothetical protein
MRVLSFVTTKCVGLSVVLFTATAGAEPPSPTDGLVCFWDFDGVLEDRAGGTHDTLSVQEGKPRFVDTSEVPGTFGQAIAIGVRPDDTGYLVAPVSEDVAVGPSYTIEAWIHPVDLNAWSRLVLRWGPAPEYAYHVAVHHGLASLYHNQSGGEYLFAEGGRVEAGRWYHVAAVAQVDDSAESKGSLTVYLNGRPVGTAPFDGTIKEVPAEGLGVGDSSGAPSASCRYRGYLDELAIWNRALTAEEIAARYAKRSGVLAELERMRREREIAKRKKLLGRFEKHGFEEIVFAERHPGRDLAKHYYANFGYSCCDPDRWLHGADGGRLSKLNVRTGEITVLLDDPKGAVRDPRVHYDGEKILFSYRKAGSHRYHLYEIGTNGTELRQITGGPWDDIEPAYLPDGDIVFCSTRAHRFIGCWLAEAATLHRSDAYGQNIRMISSGAFTENTPAVLPDGRVLYTRWEYVNRDPVSFHHLWTVNPDGSGQMAYFGNLQPGGVFIDAKPIPGTDRVVLVNSPGHGRNEHAGDVAILTGRFGPNAESAMTVLTRSGGFRDPYPLSEDAFLVTRGNQLLLMDAGGNTQVLYTSTDLDVHEPATVIRRPREKTTSTRASFADATATIILKDIYRGRRMDGVQRGQIKKLLVLEDLPKPANFHGGGSQPIGHGVTSTLKRILGTVPVEPDGSACFEVPAMRSLYFAALDENGQSVKQMRSFVTLQPGETVGCVGCHEPRHETPTSVGGAAIRALVREPSPIERIDDVPEVMDFPRDVQPVLDRHCVQCHGHQRRDGGVALVGDRGPVFSHSYYSLFLHWQVKDTGGQPRHGTGRQPGDDEPYSTFSSASPLMDKIDAGHYDVQLSPREHKLIRLWIDGGAQYAGTYAAYGTGQIGGCWGNNEPIRVMADNWPSTPPALEAVQRRCNACHPQGQLPRHVTDRIPLDTWGDMLSWTRPLSRYSRHRLYNLSRPEKSLILLAPLSHKSGGYAEGEVPSGDTAGGPVAEDRSRPPAPIVHPTIFANVDDADYQKILAHIQAAAKKLEEIKRFDMPGFKPNEHYVREMKRHGVLPQSFDLANDPIDVYAIDDAYWRKFWY